MPSSRRGASAPSSGIRASRMTSSACSCPRRRTRRPLQRRSSRDLGPRRCAVGKRALAVAAILLLGACNPDDVVHKIGWFQTMRHQRNIKPYAHPIAPVDGTVPVTGGELPVTPQTADRLVNPRTRTAESINRGKWVYQTYCLVCHGEGGKGDGPVSATGGGPFPGVRSLVTVELARRS